MKKHIILITLVCAVFSACTKTETVTTAVPDEAIAFSAYTGREITKAQVTDVTTATLSGFNVACYVAGSGTKYFKTEQTASKSDSYWKTGDTYYWPDDGSTKLDFYAYCGSGAGTVSATSAGVASLTYTMPDAGTEDLVVACAEDKGKPASAPYAQPLNFTHALAKISQLTVQSSAGVSADSHYKFIVTDVKLSNAVKKGDYCFNTSSWTLGSDKKDFTFADKSFNFAGNGSHTLQTSSKNDQFTLIPQTVTVSITYSVEYSGDGTYYTNIMTSATKTASIALAGAKAYSITLQLPNDASPITFSVTSVEDWTAKSPTLYYDGFDGLRAALEIPSGTDPIEVSIAGTYSGKCVKTIPISRPVRLVYAGSDLTINNTGDVPLFSLTGTGVLYFRNVNCTVNSSPQSLFSSPSTAAYYTDLGRFLKSSWGEYIKISEVQNYIMSSNDDYYIMTHNNEPT